MRQRKGKLDELKYAVFNCIVHEGLPLNHEVAQRRAEELLRDVESGKFGAVALDRQLETAIEIARKEIKIAGKEHRERKEREREEERRREEARRQEEERRLVREKIEYRIEKTIQDAEWTVGVPLSRTTEVCQFIEEAVVSIERGQLTFEALEADVRERVKKHKAELPKKLLVELKSLHRRLDIVCSEADLKFASEDLLKEISERRITLEVALGEEEGRLRRVCFEKAREIERLAGLIKDFERNAGLGASLQAARVKARKLFGDLETRRFKTFAEVVESERQKVQRAVERQRKVRDRLAEKIRAYREGLEDEEYTEEGGEGCVICLEDFKKSESVMYPCGHILHRLCIERMRGSQTMENRLKCPICRGADVRGNQIIRPEALLRRQEEQREQEEEEEASWCAVM